MNKINEIFNAVPMHQRKKVNEYLREFTYVLVEKKDPEDDCIILIFVNNREDLELHNCGFHVFTNSVMKHALALAYSDTPVVADMHETKDIPLTEYIPVTISDLNKLPALSWTDSLDSMIDAFWDHLPFEEEDLVDRTPLYKSQNINKYRAELILSHQVSYDGKHGQRIFRIVYANTTVAYVHADGRWGDELSVYPTYHTGYRLFIDYLKDELSIKDKIDEIDVFNHDSEATFLSSEIHSLLESNKQETEIV